ncbi:MAG: hypothetical protein P8I26_07420 [Flavobacteriaceae bacterium]|nr:hypothetical protein [Flavobacteriaceae bacterium]
MNDKKVLFITVSNLMTVRNYFHTGLAHSLSNSYHLIFLCDEDIFIELNKLGQLPPKEKFEIHSVKTSKNRLFKYLFSLFTIAHNATMYKFSSSKKMIVDQILNKKSSYLTKFLVKSKLDILFFKLFKNCLLSFRFIFKDSIKVINPNKATLVLTLPQSFLDFYIFLVLGKVVDKCVNQIFSWDNVTSRGPILNTPDYFFVWNKYVKEEVIKYYKYPENKIKLVSVPFYDFFHSNLSKNNFEIPNVKQKFTLLYATGETSFIDYEPKLVEEIYNTLKDRYNLSFIIRLHPLDKLENYNFRNHSNVKIVEPTSYVFNLKNQPEYYFSKNDYQMYVDQLINSDLILNIASTVTIDSLILGKNVANINFMPQSYNGNKNVNDYYKTDHYSKIVMHDLVPIIKNYNELFNLVDNIISNSFSYNKSKMKKFKRDFFSLENENLSSTKKLIHGFHQIN